MSTLKFSESLPNPNRPSGMFPAELMFDRRVKSVFDKLLPSLKIRTNNKKDTKSFMVGDKDYFSAYKDGNEKREHAVISSRIGKMIYMIKGKRLEHKSHHNHPKKGSLMKDLKHWKNR